LCGSIASTWYLSQSSEQQAMAVTQAYFQSILLRIIAIFVDLSEPGYKSYEEKFSTDLYFSPWCRICVYVVGLFAGYILHIYRGKVKMPKVVVFIGWLTATGVALSLIYGLYGVTSEQEMTTVQVAAFYNAVSRPLWGVCVAWVIIACTSGYGGPVTVFLNWSFFVPLSRLGYSTYLIHLYVIYWRTGIIERYFHYSNDWLIYNFIGHVIISFGLGFLIALMIEWPCQEVLRKILPGKKPPKMKNEKEKIEEFSLSSISSYSEKNEKIYIESLNKKEGKYNEAFETKDEAFSTKI